MAMGVNALRERLAEEMTALIDKDIPQEAKDALTEWLDKKDEGDGTLERKDKVLRVLDKISGDGKELADSIKAHKDYLDKKSVWIFGGDDWAQKKSSSLMY